jgi:gamma-glutamylcyclotransferase (GGCT)/AIG2-like uncharacterized protein YtfP
MLKELSLFAYGSLAEGMVHFNKISQYIVEKEEVSARGSIYRLPSGYPVFLTSDANSKEENVDTIKGVRVCLQAPDLAFRILDEFHGVSLMAPEKGLFFKEKIFVENTLLLKSECFVYAMNPRHLPKGAMRIPAGDWEKNLSEHPVFSRTLTERQSTYIKKLSQSSGRDIVPIDLDLYRELMKLELIVDKGRRLALSKLGKEVARYLPE